MAFKLYQKALRVDSELPRIYVGKTVLSITRGCMEKYFKKKTHALLYIDEDTKSIGIKPTDSKDENAYKVYQSSNSKGYFISCSGLLKKLGLKFEKGKGIEPVLSDGMLIIKVLHRKLEPKKNNYTANPEEDFPED